jgi:glutamyl endopeptidase
MKWESHSLVQVKPSPRDGSIWTPMEATLIKTSFMEETHGGGRLEKVPGFDSRRAMTAGLRHATPYARLPSGGMIAQDAGDQQDGLALVTDTASVPWRSICQLIITRQNGSNNYGTGWLAGPSLVVTAGHCIFDPKNGGWAAAITVVPGGNGSGSPPFSMWQAANIEAHQTWINRAGRSQPRDRHDRARHRRLAPPRTEGRRSGGTS